MHPSAFKEHRTIAADPWAEYERRTAERSALASRLAKRYRALLRTRHFLFGSLVGVAWLFEKERLLPLLLFVPAVAFVANVFVKNRIHGAWRQALRRLRFNQERLAKSSSQTRSGVSGILPGEPGECYLDDAHPYARDLDVFGRGSLYERLHLTGSRHGEDTLAAWLCTPAEVGEIRARQAAVAELRDRLDFREDLAMLGQALTPFPSPSERGEGGEGALCGRTLRDMRNFETIRVRLRREAVSCPLLCRVLARLRAAPLPGPLVAGRESLPLDRRLFPFMTFDRWLGRHGSALKDALAALGELEALQALAAYSFENPHDPFPELLEGGPCFEADDLGHPLLPRAMPTPPWGVAGQPGLQTGGMGMPPTCVGNDVRLGDGLRLLIVSGSNMSGKSTLLRTVGANAVLALAGGPVRARRLRLSRLMPGATLRLQDSLREGRSRFYAEVTRIRQLLQLARDQPPLLFLLDELFSGTNSDDRRQGAQAVMRRLLDADAVGLLTTHDLALTQLAELLGPCVANVHFADEFAAGQLTFDYRMRHGVLRNGNGIALMRALGIEV
jgi:hypothetical protein